MKTLSSLALVATLLVSPCILSSAALADGFPNGDPDDARLYYDENGNIQRKTWLPYREGPVDEVQPMDVMPLVKDAPGATGSAIANGQTATGVAGQGPVECDGHTEAGWEARAGLRLQEILDAWAACTGWSVHWQTDRQYVLEASATFRGDFLRAAADLVGAFGRAEPPAFGEFYQANKVLVVTTPTELDAQ